MNSEKVILLSEIFYDGSTVEEMAHISSVFPNRETFVHMVIPGEAHITVWDKVEVDK